MDFYDILFAKKLGGGGGSSVEVEALSVTENGTYTAPEGKAYSPITVNTSDDLATLKDVNFFDYDGRLLYSYTKQEWANVTDMPIQPSHNGLIANGWTIEKNAIDTAISFYYEPITVGALYITQSGKTEVDITVSGTYFSPTLRICPKGTATINWGDGSAEETLTGTSLTTGKSLNHTYSNIGNYTITIDATSGELALGGHGGSGGVAPLISSSGTGSQDNLARAYSNMIIAVRMGRNTCLSNYAFANCGSMKSITIPPKQETQSVYICNGTYVFSQCTSLMFASLTGAWGGVYIGTSIRFACETSANDNTFQNCNSLVYVNLRSTGTAVGSSSFQTCRSLMAITIPSSVTEIKGNAFNNCRSLRYIYMKSTSVPTLSSNALSTGVTSLSKIYVPYSADHSILDAYKGASNWSSYADKIEEMPQ